jgi:hypothetical protein
MAHAQAFNLRLVRVFAEADIGFAFPTQALCPAGDPKQKWAVGVAKSVERGA